MSTVTKADLEAKIGEITTALDEGFAGLNSALQAEVQQVIDAIAEAQKDPALGTTLDLLEGLKGKISGKVSELQGGIGGIVTPAPVPEPTPEPTPEPELEPETPAAPPRRYRY